MHGGSVSKHRVMLGRAWESCWDDWVNRVRLASDCTSTRCWWGPSPFCCFLDRCEPLQENKINNGNDDIPCTQSGLKCPLHCPSPSHNSTGLTSPPENVSWQNRKAAVCSRHLKVHLHTLPVPAKSVSPTPSLPGQRERSTETRDQRARRLLLFLLQTLFYDYLYF